MADGGTYEASKPTWERLSIHCGSCGEDWTDWHPQGCAMEVWISVMSALRCVHCGEDRHLFVRAPRLEIPRDD